MIAEENWGSLSALWSWCVFPPFPRCPEQLLSTRVSGTIRCPGGDLLLHLSGSHLDSSVLPSLTGSLPVESRLEERFSSTFDRFLWLSGSSVSLKWRKHVVHWCNWGEARMRGLVVYLKCHLILKKSVNKCKSCQVPVRFFTFI